MTPLWASLSGHSALSNVFHFFLTAGIFYKVYCESIKMYMVKMWQNTDISFKLKENNIKL